MKALVIMGLMLLLSGCQPSDQRVKNIRQLLDEGETITLTKKGERFSTCFADSPDWQELRINTDEERHRIVLGQQRSVINPGYKPCFRVGSIIYFETNNHRVPGRARVDAISLVKLDKLKRSRLKGSYFTTTEDFNKYRDGFKFSVGKYQYHTVTVVDVTYLSGSAVDEKTIVDEDKRKNEGPGYMEVTTPGQFLPDQPPCKETWTDTWVQNTEFQEAIKAGQLKSWPRFGEKNCATPGSEMDLKAGENQPAFARVKITRVKRFKRNAVNKDYFNVDNFDLTSIFKYIDDNSGRSRFITVIDFELIQPNMILQAECETGLPITHSDDAGPIEVVVRSPSCAKPGQLLKVLSVENMDRTLEIPVRVKSKYSDPESETTVLILERLDQESKAAQENLR